MWMASVCASIECTSVVRAFTLVTVSAYSALNAGFLAPKFKLTDNDSAIVERAAMSLPSLTASVI